VASVDNVVHQTVSVGNTATQVFGEDNVGGFMLLQNVSDADMFLSFTDDAALNAGIYLKAGATLLLDSVVIDGALSAIHGSTGNKTLLVTIG
jgi:hypothetical protein